MSILIFIETTRKYYTRLGWGIILLSKFIPNILTWRAYCTYIYKAVSLCLLTSQTLLEVYLRQSYISFGSNALLINYNNNNKTVYNKYKTRLPGYNLFVKIKEHLSRPIFILRDVEVTVIDIVPMLVVQVDTHIFTEVGNRLLDVLFWWRHELMTYNHRWTL